MADAAAPDPYKHTSDGDVEKHEEALPAFLDAFGDEEDAEVKYKVLSWWYVPTPSLPLARIMLNNTTTGNAASVRFYQASIPR